MKTKQSLSVSDKVVAIDGRSSCVVGLGGGKFNLRLSSPIQANTVYCVREVVRMKVEHRWRCYIKVVGDDVNMFPSLKFRAVGRSK